MRRSGGHYAERGGDLQDQNRAVKHELKDVQHEITERKIHIIYM